MSDDEGPSLIKKKSLGTAMGAARKDDDELMMQEDSASAESESEGEGESELEMDETVVIDKAKGKGKEKVVNKVCVSSVSIHDQSNP